MDNFQRKEQYGPRKGQELDQAALNSPPLEAELHSLLDERIVAPKHIQVHGDSDDFNRAEAKLADARTTRVEVLIARGVNINAEREYRRYNARVGESIFESLTPIEVAMRHCNLGKDAAHHRQGRGPNYKLVEVLLKHDASIPDRMVDTEYATGDIKIAFAKQRLGDQTDTCVATSLLEREVSASDARPNRAYLEYLIAHGAIVSESVLSEVQNAERSLLNKIVHEDNWAPYDGERYDIKSVLASLHIARTEQQGGDVATKATEILVDQLKGRLDSSKVYVSLDATAFLLSKGARLDEALVAEFEFTADQRAGGFAEYKGWGWVYEAVGSLLNIALMKQRLAINPGAIHEKDSDGFTPLDKALRSRLETEMSTFYSALVVTKNIFEAASYAEIDLGEFTRQGTEQEPDAELTESDLEPRYLLEWKSIIESGKYPKAYQEDALLQVHGRYVQFLLDQGAEVTTETYKFVRGCSFAGRLHDNYREGFFNVIDSATGELIPTMVITALRHKYEAARSAEIMGRDVLPADMSNDSWAFKLMGITLGEQVQGEPLFIYATLPEGWTKEISKEDPREIYLLCPEGGRKAYIYYDPNPDGPFAQLRLCKG